MSLPPLWIFPLPFSWFPSSYLASSLLLFVSLNEKFTGVVLLARTFGLFYLGTRKITIALFKVVAVWVKRMMKKKYSIIAIVTTQLFVLSLNKCCRRIIFEYKRNKIAFVTIQFSRA